MKGAWVELGHGLKLSTELIGEVDVVLRFWAGVAQLRKGKRVVGFRG